MRSTKLLLKRLAVLLAKMTLVALPAVISSYYSYLAGTRDAVRDYRALSEMATSTVALLERQGRVLERMRGEVNILSLLASARVGAGFPALPLPEQLLETESYSDCPRYPFQSVATREDHVRVTRRLTTPK